MTRHLPDDRLDHGKAVETVILVGLSPRIVDHREGVEREARSKRELDEAPALKLDRVLERAAIVDDHDFGTRTAQGRTQLLEQHRLARPGLAANRDFVVVSPVLAPPPTGTLPHPADPQEEGNQASQGLALQRPDI